MKNILIIFFIASVLNAQALELIYDGVTPKWAIDLDGSIEDAYVDNPSGLDLNSANYLTGDNTAFTTTVGNWVNNGAVSSSIVSNKMQVVASGHTTSDYISLQQSAFSTPFVHGHNCTVQLGASSLASSSIKIGCGNSLSSAITTTGTEATYAYTFKYDSTGMMKFNNNLNLTSWSKNIPNNGQILSSNSWSKTTGNCGVYKNSAVEIGKTYRIHLVGNKKSISNYIRISNVLFSAPYYSDMHYENNFVIDNIFTAHSQTSIMFYSLGAVADTITISEFTLEELPALKIYPQVSDTYTVDNVDVSEAYDLEIEGYFKANNIATTQYILSTNTGNNIRLGLTSSKLYFRPDNSQSSSYVYSSTLSSNTWYKYKVLYNRLTKVASCYINNTLDNGTQSTSSAWLYKENTTGLRVGLMSTTYFSGLIGWTDIKLKNGLGAVVNETKYDWKGDANNSLDDKGTNGNDLIGVNIGTGDVVKYKGGYD